MNNGIICIKKISQERLNGRARLVFDVTENGHPKQTFFDVEEKYGEYLCCERCDAIVIGILSYAMRHGYDIESEIPITEDLLYNINEYLIPALTKYDSKLTPIKIFAAVAGPMANAGAIGTGLSCGVDSFYTVLSHTNTAYKNHNITHLLINNVGAFGVYYEQYGTDRVKKDCYDRARKVAKELCLPLIETNSDFQTSFLQNHLQTHTYSSVFAVYCLQKLWKTFYYASTYGLDDFSLKNNSDEDAAFYEIFSLNCFSTDKLRIYSGGAAIDRLQKVERIANNKIVQDNLHVCAFRSYNCNVCGKCRRTLLELYALNKIEKFSNVFDIEYFKKNKNEYLDFLYFEHIKNDSLNEPTYQALKKEMEIVADRMRREEELKRRKKLIETIFSVKNENTSNTTRKVVTILGMKIKLKKLPKLGVET